MHRLSKKEVEETNEYLKSDERTMNYKIARYIFVGSLYIQTSRTCRMVGEIIADIVILYISLVICAKSDFISAMFINIILNVIWSVLSFGFANFPPKIHVNSIIMTGIFLLCMCLAVIETWSEKQFLVTYFIICISYLLLKEGIIFISENNRPKDYENL